MVLVNTSESASGSIIELDLQTGGYRVEVSPKKLRSATGLGGFAVIDEGDKSLVALIFNNNKFNLIVGEDKWELDSGTVLNCTSNFGGFQKKFEIVHSNTVLCSLKYKLIVKSKLLNLLDFFSDSLDREMDDIFLFLSNSYNDQNWRKEFGEKWELRSRCLSK